MKTNISAFHQLNNALASIQGLVILGLNFYAFVYNRSGHTGLPLQGFNLFFGACLLFSALACFKADYRRIALLNLILALIGLFNLYAFDAYNIMLPYETWIDRGLQ